MITPTHPSIWKLRPNEAPRTPHNRAYTLLYEGESVLAGTSSACIRYVCLHGLPEELVETVEGWVTVAEWRASHEQAEKMRARVAEARTKVTAIRAGLPAECREIPISQTEVRRLVKSLEMEGVKR